MLKNTKYPSIIAYITLPGERDIHSVLSASYVSTATVAAPHRSSMARVIGARKLKSVPITHITVNGIHADTRRTQNSQ